MPPVLHPPSLYNLASESTMAFLLRILLIEHADADMLSLLRELQRGGYDVDHYRVDSPATLDKALSSRVWDIILCSEQLPHFAVLDALAILKASGHNLPFLLRMGTAGNDTAVTSFHLVGGDYVVTDGPLALLSAISQELRAVQERRSQSPTISGSTATAPASNK